MKTASANGYAKLNLYLDVVGTSDGYHMLDTLVITISLFDSVTVSPREDDEIKVFEHKGLFFKQLDETNNAFKAAKLFKDKFEVGGFNVYLTKKIPIGSGMGGSSADIAGTLLALKKAFELDCDLKPLADSLGSDSGYLLTGGYAKLTGRGEKVETLDIKKKLYFVVVTPEGGVDTTKCFNLFDSSAYDKPKFDSNKLITALYEGFCEKDMFFNALFEPAKQINPLVEKAFESIKSLSPNAVCMSGSGSSVFGIFDSLELCEWAKKKLKRQFKQVFVVESLTQDELPLVENDGKCIYQI